MRKKDLMIYEIHKVDICSIFQYVVGLIHTRIDAVKGFDSRDSRSSHPLIALPALLAQRERSDSPFIASNESIYKIRQHTTPIAIK